MNVPAAKRQFYPVAAVLLFIFIYFCAGKFGLSLAYVNRSASAVWPPTGLALAALLLWGNRLWPGIFIGALLVNLTTQGSLPANFGIAAGNTLEALVAAGLVRRFAGGLKVFERVNNTLKYFFLAATFSTAISASIGVASLCLEHCAQWHQYGAIWTTWWMGDMVSDWVIAPFILIWLSPPRPRWKAGQIAEGLLLLLLLFAICKILFGRSDIPAPLKQLEFLVVFPILWAVFRFGPRGAITCAVVICGITLWGTVSGMGPFVTANPNVSLLLLQTYSATMTMISLVLVAIMAEHQQAEKVIRASEERYRAVVEEQTEVISRCSPDGTFQFVNDVCCRFFGKTREELLGRRWHSIPVPEDLPLVEKELYKLSPASPVVTVENRVRGGDGQIYWMQFVNRGVFDAGGRLVEIQSVGRNITDRKRTDARLAVLGRAVEGTNEMICITDTNDRFTFANRAFLECYGYAEAEILGKTPGLLLSPNNPPTLLPEILEQTRGGGWRGEVLDQRKDGTEFWISLSTAQITDSTGHIIGLIGIAQDITAHKQLETALRHSEENYRSLAESSPDAIFIVDRSLRVQYVNQAATLWLGKPASELLGRSQGELFTQPVAHEQEESIRQVFATGELLRKERSRLFQGKKKWIETRLMPLRNERGEVVSVMGISRDLTEQRHAQEQFKESEAWSRKVLDTSLEGFFRLNQQGQFLDVNETYCRMIGYTREELLTMRISDVSLLTPSASDVGPQIQRIIDLGGERFESRHRCKNGSIIELECVVSYFKMRENYVFSFLRDITERKQLERQLSEISATERQRIGYDLHDGLGQQLAGIAFKTKVLEENLAAASSDQASEAAEIVKLLNDAISQTRSLARMLAPVEVEDKGLPAALENLATETQNLFRVDCVFSCSVESLTLEAKIGMTLYRIAQEAIHNAINRGGASRIEIHLTLQIGTHVCLAVRDNGKGFVTTPKPTTGMGLRIMKYRASSIGGGISIDSKVGKDTELRCLLPLNDR